MKVLILYRPISEHGRIVDEFIRNFESRGIDTELEVIDIDTREGADVASLYDIVQYPAILVLESDGTLQKIWTGEQLPMIDELVAYARA